MARNGSLFGPDNLGEFLLRQPSIASKTNQLLRQFG